MFSRFLLFLDAVTRVFCIPCIIKKVRMHFQKKKKKKQHGTEHY